MSIAPPSEEKAALRSVVRCINCWAKFGPDEVVWISESHEHFGDRLLGPDQPSRFRTLRFSPEGDGVDGYGSRCPDMACPHCHLSIPRDLLGLRPLFLSILGSPSCGKSFYLAALTHQLRRELPRAFALDFSDADHISNQPLAEYEQSVFLRPNPDVEVPLGDLIPKTELQGRLYNSVLQRGQNVLLPRPLSFRLTPASGHPHEEDAESHKRLICLYDNAGEHFLPGQDNAAAPATRHLAVSDALLFMYDPLQDPRFVRATNSKRLLNQVQRYQRPVPQEAILRECSERIRRHQSIDGARKKPPRLIVVVTKMDEWKRMTPDLDCTPPYAIAPTGLARVLNLAQIERHSQALRAVLKGTVPEIVQAAEMVSDDPVFLGVSALGHQPRIDDEDIAWVRPSAIRPELIELPFALSIATRTRGLIRTAKPAG